MRLRPAELRKARREAGDSLRAALRAEKKAREALTVAGPGDDNMNLERYIRCTRRTERAMTYAKSLYPENESVGS